MNPQIEFYKAAFSQRGARFKIFVFRGTSRYKYCQGLGDVLREIVRLIPRVAQFFKPVAIKGVRTFLKAGRKAIKQGVTVKVVIKSTLKLTVNADLGATVDQIASKLIEMRNNQNDAPPLNPPIMLPELNQAWSGKKRRRQTVCEKTQTKQVYIQPATNYL